MNKNVNIWELDEFDFWDDNRTGKEKAIWFVTRKEIEWKKFDKYEMDFYLKDKDVILKYIETHSSNKLFEKGFPIDIVQSDFLIDSEFITKVIENLDTDYSKDGLSKLLKLSTAEIIKNMMSSKKIEDPEHYTEDPEFWKAYARMYLEGYADSLAERDAELSKKAQVLDEILNYEIPSLDGKNSDNYKKCNIGFTAKF